MKLTHNMPTQKDIRENDLIGLGISKEEVQEKDFERFDQYIKTQRMAKHYARSKTMITFAYDDVEEEIYQIQEIREYVQDMLNRCPELFYYINLDDKAFSSFLVLLLCLSEIQEIVAKNSIKTKLAMKPNIDVLLQIIKNIEAYTQIINDTDIRSIHRICDYIVSFAKGQV